LYMRKHFEETAEDDSAYACAALPSSPIRRRIPMRSTNAWKQVLAAALNLTAASALAQAPTSVKPMAADAHPSFAIATVKPHDPNSNRQGFNATGDRLIIRNQTIVSLMMMP